MECRRCEFENVPGVERCLRCGAALAAPEGFGVEPRRHKAPRLFSKIAYRMRRGGGGIAERVKVVAARPAEERQPIHDYYDTATDALVALIRSIIPGLGQWLQGRRKRAAAYFLVWLCLLVMAIVSNVALGLAISVHVMAVTDLQRAGRLSGPVARIIVSLLLFVMLWLFAYMPLMRLSDSYATRMWVPAREVLGLNEGGSYLMAFRRGGAPERGDFVVYNMAPLDTRLPANVIFRTTGGPTFGYVAGVPGDAVSIADGIVTVNGEPFDTSTTSLHVRLTEIPRGFRGPAEVVPAGKVFVLPAGTGLREYAWDAETTRLMMEHVFMQDEGRVDFKLWMVLRPLRRFGFV